MSRNKRACHPMNTKKYLVYVHPAQFQMQNGGCVIRVYDPDSVKLVPTETQRPTNLAEVSRGFLSVNYG